MKRVNIIITLWVICVSLSGQQISNAEYFFDNDPGFGNAIPLEIDSGQEVTVNLDIPLPGMDPGIHIFYARVKNSLGKWSQTYNRIFWVQRLPFSTPPVISKMEFFFDEDPGYGMASPLQFEPGTDLSLAFDLPLSSLSGGIHSLYLRCMDSNGIWSMVYPRNFLVQALPSSVSYQVVRMEYFMDEDPGFGKGISLELIPGSDVAVEANLPLENITDGIHTLYVRALDSKGGWGNVFYQVFIKFTAYAELTNVSAFEYFINTDPGFGKGTRVDLKTPRETAMKYFIVDTEGVQPGTNRLYVRALDSFDRWGMVYSTEFEVLQSEPCTGPDGLTASNITETGATMQWEDQGSPSAWDILYLPSGLEFSEDGTLHKGVIVNPSPEENLLPSTLYNFYVRSLCSDGQVSDWAGPGIFHTLPLPVNQLSLFADPPQGGSLSGGGNYEYGKPVDITATPNSNFVFNYWSGDTVYLSNTRTATPTLTMPASAVSLTAHFIDVTGIAGYPVNDLRIFPNPSKEFLWIEFSNPGNSKVDVLLVNMMGKVVSQQVFDQAGSIKQSIPTSALTEGLYLVILRGENWNISRRLVVKR